jgi:asparagine synthase (glutamine-hydrolysing)
MCGITGFVGDEEKLSFAERSAILDRMCRVISHRGPDDQGMMMVRGAALGMRRLSIIDLDKGSQPISGEDGSVSVVFNGEIYNYKELKRELECKGHRFRTNSDTESIVHAYEEYGPQCVERLRGMFALAVWDDWTRELFLARDRVGKKPLFYAATGSGELIFGSELKSLLEHPSIERNVDPDAVDAYLTFGYVPDPLCIFKGIRKLPPGHSLICSGGKIEIRQYWDFSYDRTGHRTEKEYAEELRALLEESVRIRLVADVPLGAFLSGGIDSTSIVGLMSKLSDKPVKTFSIGFDEESFDELKFARLAARRFGAEHQEFVVRPNVCDLVDRLVWHVDEPFADPSAVPTYVVSKLAAEHVKVVLTGDGGDELFAGYTRYVRDRKRSGFARLPRLFRKGLIQPLCRRLPHGAYGRNYLHNVSLDPLDRYVDTLSVFTELEKEGLYAPEFRRRIRGGAAGRFSELARAAGSSQALDWILYLDSKTYLPGDILTKVDRMSMAVSLEARAPLLDHKLVEFAAAIPPDLKMKDLETKHIFKLAVKDLVPPEILNRPKQGFSVPVGKWMNNQLRDRIVGTLTEPRTNQRGYVDAGFVGKLLDEHRRGRRDHAWTLWALFMLELWHRTFVDGCGSHRRNVVQSSNTPELKVAS